MSHMSSEEKLARMRPYLTIEQWRQLPDRIRQRYGNIKEHYDLMERLESCFVDKPSIKQPKPLQASTATAKNRDKGKLKKVALSADCSKTQVSVPTVEDSTACARKETASSETSTAESSGSDVDQRKDCVGIAASTDASNVDSNAQGTPASVNDKTDQPSGCPKNGSLVSVLSTEEPTGDELLANKTLPDFLSIRQSNVKGCQYGVFTLKPLTKGTYFGPYRSFSVNNDEGKKGTSKVRHSDGKSLAIGPPTDGSDWMRYLNRAPTQLDQNLVASVREGKFYYRTCRAIGAGQELLVEEGMALAKVERPVDKTLDCSKPGQVADGGDSGQRHAFTCDDCSSLFSSQDLLDIHRRTKHRPLQRAKHRCTFCTYSSDRKEDVTVHARTHPGKRLFPCSVCHKSFPHKNLLLFHLRTVHAQEIKWPECPDCGRRFGRMSGLTRHRSVHSGDPKSSQESPQ